MWFQCHFAEIDQRRIMCGLFQFQYQIGSVHDRKCHFFFGAFHFFYVYAFFKEGTEDFFTPDHQFAVINGGAAIVECFTDTFRRTFFGKDKRHRAVFAFWKIIVCLDRLVDIGSSYHGQILVQTPLNGFGHEKATIGYLNAMHTAVVVELRMLRPPQGGVRLLACPARMIPEDKGSLFFCLIESVFICLLFQWIGVVQEDCIKMSRRHGTGDFTASD